jgi:hypothetical protein
MCHTTHERGQCQLSSCGLYMGAEIFTIMCNQGDVLGSLVTQYLSSWLEFQKCTPTTR